ncbi:hypothetical protein LNQ49_10945 [Flavobacterium sp. F-65]|uniref:Bacteriocin-type signal sequence-containing protein n=1 Tax=Flavobacterium pisciphilum TaxID=2893755 RepID=A0ABS8MTM0_9FLAO|nr:hypothetical protein [Flavobacterium sp. F-65]MCC9072096.1 hypothetical protein [Flavobacterium sp. F-65]
MLKSILNLDGVKRITNNEQKEIKGGNIPPDGECGAYQILPLSETACRNYDPYYRPVYIGPNQCSIMLAPC